MYTENDLSDLYKFLLVCFFISMPLAIWKIIDVLMCIYRYVSVTVH